MELSVNVLHGLRTFVVKIMLHFFKKVTVKYIFAFKNLASSSYSWYFDLFRGLLKLRGSFIYF